MSTLRGSKNYVWDTAKPLGQGATSLVYIGREKRTGEEVAVKVFTPQSFQRPRQVQLREFEVMKRLNHENVVRLLAIEEEQTMGGGEVIVMELCQNGSLYNVIDSPENSYGLCEEEFLLVLTQVSAGMKHLRDHDIIHRDIKPGNILRCVAEDGRSIYKLTDFGAARELQENEEFVSLYGTEEYLHPDMFEKAVLRQVRGQQFGVHVDLWSLGVTFYHAATGNLPFRPYGGRRNKETMHLITTTKEAGVISGVQLTENGRIEYRSELPNTCRLSLGLKRLVTPFLAALLEKDQTRTWPFDQFFDQVAVISSKMVIDAFCPSLLLTMKVYADTTDTLARLRELIAEQTDIPPTDQLLLVGGQKLSSLVQGDRPIRDYHLDISSTNPIMVFSISGAFPQRVHTPAVGQFPQLTQAMALDHDYPQCKRCCGVLHSIIEAVRVTTETTTLVNMAVHMYCCHLKQQLSVLQESLSRLEPQMGVMFHWKQGIITQLEHHLSLLHLNHLTLGPAADKVSKWVKVIQVTHQTHKTDCHNLFQLLQASSVNANTQLQEALSMQSSVSDWDTSLGCTPSDRCAEKVRVMLDRMKKILTMFKENRAKRHLNYNEEQIHKFEKNKLSELCTQARSMLTDNCLRKRKNLYVNYKLWFGKAAQCQAQITVVASSVRQITDNHAQLVAKLKKAEADSSKLINECVTHLSKEVSTPQAQAANQNQAGPTTNAQQAKGANQLQAGPIIHTPQANQMGAGHLVNGNAGYVQLLNGSSDLMQGPSSGGNGGGGSGHFSGSSNMASRQDRLDSLLDGISTSRQSLEELEKLVNENTMLIRNFGSLTEDAKFSDTS